MNKLMVRMNKKNKKGFTLVELIVVMAILAILAAILIPSVSGMIRRSNQAVDNATGRNLYMAGAMVAAQSEDVNVTITNNASGVGAYGTFTGSGQTSVENFIGTSAPTLKTATSMTLDVTSAGVVTVYKNGTATDKYDTNSGSFSW